MQNFEKILSKTRLVNAPGKVKKSVVHCPITIREKEVIRLVAEGFTADEIACELFLSLDTVETHKKNLIKKLKCRNTAHAVAKAVKLGLI